MVGDEIFQLKDYLIHPYPEIRSAKLHIDQTIFKYRLSIARSVRGNCFGNLAARWRLFRRLIGADKENVISCMSARVVLHYLFQQRENKSYCREVSWILKSVEREWRRIVFNDAV